MRHSSSAGPRIPWLKTKYQRSAEEMPMNFSEAGLKRQPPDFVDDRLNELTTSERVCIRSYDQCSPDVSSSARMTFTQKVYIFNAARVSSLRFSRGCSPAPTPGHASTMQRPAKRSK
jgi:hypothetical protein